MWYSNLRLKQRAENGVFLPANNGGIYYGFVKVVVGLFKKA